MRYSHFIQCFLLFTALFYLLSVDPFHSHPQTFASEGRPARKYLDTSFSNPEHEYHRVKDHKQEISSNTHEYEKSIDGADELVYHIDYNGPKTHPNPPDHP
ncbi:hypothetical protein SDJN02_15408 [Cucurbita argyrosperma subsp. argyrosperma]